MPGSSYRWRLVSHAASLRGAASVATAVLALHILAGALWVGGIAALCLAVILLVRAGERAAARALALSFGELAIVSVAVLAITGIAILGIHVRSLDALVSTGYGQVLIVKTALFLLAGAIGVATTVGLRWHRAPGALRAAWGWTARLELAVLAAVLVPAALLTASAPPRAGALEPSPSTAPIAAQKSFANIGDLVLSVAVEPNRPGTNFVTVDVADTRRPAPAPIRAVTLSLSGPSAARSIALKRIGADQWQAVTRLRPGKVRIGIAVERPPLPDATTTTGWAVSSRSLPPATRVAQAPESGIMERPLEPILKPIAIGGAALLLLLFFIARIWRSRTSAPRPGATAQRLSGDLQPRRADQ